MGRCATSFRLRSSFGKFEELEDSLYTTRKPPILKTTGGEVIQSTFPKSSKRWVGVPPRFGSEVPSERYVGFGANELSRWLSVDKKVRINMEKSFYDRPVRHYLKIDDTIDVHKETGSHMRYFKNPLDDEWGVEQIEAPKILGITDRFDDEREGRERTRFTRKEDREDNAEDEDDGWEYYDEDDEEEEWDPYADSQSSRSGQPVHPDLDRKFQEHVNSLGPKLRVAMSQRMGEVESNWRQGQNTRSATLRCRR
jgi:hypothetical protein